jgi:ACS family pantothenate transporter-like MFS transporter
MWAMIAVSIAMAIWVALLSWQQVRTEKRRDTEAAGISVAQKEEDLSGMQGQRGSADLGLKV